MKYQNILLILLKCPNNLYYLIKLFTSLQKKEINTVNSDLCPD